MRRGLPRRSDGAAARCQEGEREEHDDPPRVPVAGLGCQMKLRPYRRHDSTRPVGPVAQEWSDRAAALTATRAGPANHAAAVSGTPTSQTRRRARSASWSRSMWCLPSYQGSAAGNWPTRQDRKHREHRVTQTSTQGPSPCRLRRIGPCKTAALPQCVSRRCVHIEPMRARVGRLPGVLCMTVHLGRNQTRAFSSRSQPVEQLVALRPAPVGVM